FEQGETEVRAKNAGLAGELETTFAWLRTRVARADDAERHAIRERLLAGLERAERIVADRPSTMSRFVASLFLLVREGFETILFYKSLFTSASSSSVSVIGRIAAGSVGLVAVYLIINQLGLRVAMKPFFAVTGVMLYYMAFVFAGKGIAELQEARIIPLTVIESAPRIPVLGIYPTLESLLVQGLLLALALVAAGWSLRPKSSGRSAE